MGSAAPQKQLCSSARTFEGVVVVVMVVVVVVMVVGWWGSGAVGWWGGGVVGVVRWWGGGLAARTHQKACVVVELRERYHVRCDEVTFAKIVRVKAYVQRNHSGGVGAHRASVTRSVATCTADKPDMVFR